MRPRADAGKPGSLRSGAGFPARLPAARPRLSLAGLARLRGNAYAFLGAAYLYPDAERLDALRAMARAFRRQDDLLAGFAFFDPWRRLVTALAMPAEAVGSTLEAEYVRLMMLNPEAPPYESHYRDPTGQARGTIAARLAGEYTAAGLALSPAFREPPDHAAVELEFMAFLCGLEARAWARPDPGGGVQALRRQQRFLERHLGAWIGVFARQVRRLRPGGIYALASEATEAFVRHDRDLVDLLLNGLGDGTPAGSDGRGA